jgi:uncharacterized membrane protein YphA (DoxX/SURF4 family)
MATRTNRSLMTSALWIAQGLLALLFVMSGLAKLFTPLELLAEQFAPLPGMFMRFIGLIEVLGALGLILPGLLRILPVLTPLAAAGLLINMLSATIYTVVFVGLTLAVFPLVAGVLSAFVAYGRWRVAPLRGRDQPTGARLSSQEHFGNRA